ncbi:MAG: hypothetical protein SFW67_15465 [Myxococcaceae bacterium]|nr:hypothetical protein [Myxococcaceae bacterium]
MRALLLLFFTAVAIVVPCNEALRSALAPVAQPGPAPALMVSDPPPHLDAPRVRHLLGFGDEAPVVGVTPRAPPTPFEARLLGTLRSSVPGQSIATLLLPSGKTTSAWEGEWVLGAQVVAIDHTSITVRRDDRDEIVSVGVRAAEAPRSRAVGKVDFTVSRATVRERMANLMQLSSEVRVVPAFKDGVAVGFRLFAARPDWAPGQLGVQSGDLIRSVNGQPLDSVERVMALTTLLERGGDLDLELERAGTLFHQRYRLD